MHRLYEEHRAIEGAAHRLKEALSAALAGDAARLAGIGALRQELAMHLQKHLFSENDLLIDRLDSTMRSRLPGFQEVISSTRELRLAYSAHVVHWHHRCVTEDLKGYVASVESMIVRLHAQIALEEKSLYAPGLRLLDAA